MPQLNNTTTLQRQVGVPKIVTLARTGNQTIDASASSVQLIKPTASLTLSVSGGIAGQQLSLLVEQLNTSSVTLTFGTGFKSTGTLATGTAASRMFVLTFVSDGTNFYERSRTAAITVS